MEEILTLVLGLILGALLALAFGWVFSLLWNWILLSVFAFNLPALNVFTGTGVLLFLGLISRGFRTN